MQKLFSFFKLLIFLALTLVIGFSFWLVQLNSELNARLKSPWFLPPVEIYSAPLTFWKDQALYLEKVKSQLISQNFRSRHPQQKLFPGDFAIWPSSFCQDLVPLKEQVTFCLAIKTPSPSSKTFILTLSPQSNFYKIQQVFSGPPLQETSHVALQPQLFAQFYGKQPVLRQVLQMGDIPLYCLEAITAIEDKNFLFHKGVSPLGILRATITNLLKGRIAQGGSTITQQLVKNYFLTPERTFRRKFKEIFLAILLEMKLSKEEILQTYLNVIYMGQNGPFQIRGYGAAAQHYFGKDIKDLNLPECATLAAIVNSPGRYDPFKRPENTKKRRALVLKKMAENNMIEEEQLKTAITTPLPLHSPEALKSPAPYFVQAVQRQLEQLHIEKTQGLRIFTSLNEEFQRQAQTIVPQILKQLEQKTPHLQNLTKSGKKLEAVLLSLDLRTNGLLALIGGRHYQDTQFNRALDAHRQVGSIMKPIVYLTALESTTPDGEPYTPLTLIPDEPFTYKYDGQSWSPQNYDHQFRGPVPLFYALKNSINVPTVRLGLQVGLSSIVDMARRLGITSTIQPLPSLTLGAFELYPLEVLTAYSTIAHMGTFNPPQIILRVEDLQQNVLYQATPHPSQEVAPETTAVLIGMLKQTLLTGTARSVTQWRGFLHPAAGKTGTTSDTKDTWFVGFTPYVLTLVWVGYDDNTPLHLTGASAAVPLWTAFMKKVATLYPPDDFPWPEGTIEYELSPKELQRLVKNPRPDELNKPTILIFRQGNE